MTDTEKLQLLKQRIRESPSHTAILNAELTSEQDAKLAEILPSLLVLVKS